MSSCLGPMPLKERERSLGRSLLLAALHVCLLLLIGGSVQADDFEDLPWVEHSSSVLMGDHSLPEAKDRALALARSKVIAKAYPQYSLRATDTRLTQEDNEGYNDFFSRLVRREITAVIVQEEEPRYDFLELAEGELQVICTLRAKVAPNNSPRDSGFKVYVRLLNGEDQEATTFLEGDEMILEIRSTRECYLTVFNIYSDGTVSALVPNTLMPDNRLIQGEIVQVPSERQRKQQGIRFRVSLPKDRDILHESIQVVATLDERPFVSFKTSELGGSFLPTFESAWEELNAWLIQIPADRRAEGESFYTIAR